MKHRPNNLFRDIILAILGAMIFIILSPFYLIVVLGDIMRK